MLLELISSNKQRSIESCMDNNTYKRRVSGYLHPGQVRSGAGGGQLLTDAPPLHTNGSVQMILQLQVAADQEHLGVTSPGSLRTTRHCERGRVCEETPPSPNLFYAVREEKTCGGEQTQDSNVKKYILFIL